ncbi:MAG: matrixin family metalloprotease [Deltaproteobacteria bacterium]|nr:matrixin family metalloprotease [Deltaproteobacteria bacterium]
MRSTHPSLFILAALGLQTATAFAAPALETDGGTPLAWPKRSAVAVEVSDAGAVATSPELARALADALSTWTKTSSETPAFLVAPAVDASVQNTRAIHRAQVLERDWPADDTALAITTYTFKKSTGEITDADIIVNGTGPCLSLSDATPKDCYDLRAVLVHEAGHFLGLAHDEKNADSLMYPTLAPGDASRRTLPEVDEDSLLAAYGGARRDEADKDSDDARAALSPQNFAVARAGCNQHAASPIAWLVLALVLFLRTRFTKGSRS